MTIARLRVIWAWSLTLVVMLVGLSTSAHAQAASCPGNKPGRFAVKIDSAPQGAAIYINDKSCPAVGVTPWEGKLNNGDYTVIIEAPGYDLATRPFKVARVRKAQELFIPLVKKLDPPKIDVRADSDKNVAGATVVLDGQPQGQAPIVLTTTAGRHLVQIKKDGYEDNSTWLDTKENQVQTFAPTLKELAKPKYGTIVVDADTQDAEVYIDGNKHPDNTPAVINNVIEGVHVIEVRKGALTWKQTIDVKANQQVKLRADLAASGVGVVRVITDAPGARAFIDGADMGPVPVDIKDVKAGDHVVQVKSASYNSSERHVNVTAGGSQIVKFDPNADLGADAGVIRVTSTVPDAVVFVDGAQIGHAPQDKRVTPGDHPVLVTLDGYKKFEAKIHVDAGQTQNVSADLKPVGRIRVLSQPTNAAVMINGVPVGQTPLDTEVEVGEAVVRIEQPGFQAFEQNLVIEGGKTLTLSRELAISGPSEMQMIQEQASLSSFGARALPRGRSTVDFGVGFPYYLNGRVTVGIGRVPGLAAFDATIQARTMFVRTELGIGGRMTFVDVNPVAVSAFTNFWYGSSLFDDSRRNGLTWDFGTAVSLTALQHVTITGRAYAEVWSDRHCPGLDQSMPNGFSGTDPIQVCVDEKNGTISAAEASRVRTLIGSTGALFDRETSARFMLSLIAEVALRRDLSMYFILEGAPFLQPERALFTSTFSSTMPDNDPRVYGQIGFSYKF
jgi:hypothetical protein